MPQIPNRMTDAMLDGLEQTFTYDGGGKILQIVCVQDLYDGGYVTCTKTFTYPDSTHMVSSAWVCVKTP